MSAAATGWTARKAAVEAEARAEQAARREAERAETQAQMEARPDAELLAEAGLPDPDTVDSPDIVQQFLNSDLPQRLKQRALRRLWRMNPVLANVDGLVDYGEDFTDAALAVDKIQTVYTVGKGMLEQFKALAEDVPEEAAEGAEPSSDISEPPVDAAPAATIAGADDPAPQPEPPEAGTPPDVADNPPDAADTDDAPIHAVSRRMRFRFDT